MIIYICIALSFSISSLFFIHFKGLDQAGVKSPLFYTVTYLVLAFVAFPMIIFAWLYDSKGYVQVYGEELAKLIEEDE